MLFTFEAGQSPALQPARVHAEQCGLYRALGFPTSCRDSLPGVPSSGRGKSPHRAAGAVPCLALARSSSSASTSQPAPALALPGTLKPLEISITWNVALLNGEAVFTPTLKPPTGGGHVLPVRLLRKGNKGRDVHTQEPWARQINTQIRGRGFVRNSFSCYAYSAFLPASLQRFGSFSWSGFLCFGPICVLSWGTRLECTVLAWGTLGSTLRSLQQQGLAHQEGGLCCFATDENFPGSSVFTVGKAGLLGINSQTNAERLLCNVRAWLPHPRGDIPRLPWGKDGPSARAALELAQCRSILLCLRRLSVGSCTLSEPCIFLYGNSVCETEGKCSLNGLSPFSAVSSLILPIT